jgi:hypothetical protein
MPVTVDCNPAIAGADRRLQAASVSGPLQGSVQLAFDHGLDEAAHPITHRGFNRVEPIVEKIHSRISDGLRGIMLRGNYSSWRGLLSGASTPDDSRLNTPKTRQFEGREKRAIF